MPTNSAIKTAEGGLLRKSLAEKFNIAFMYYPFFIFTTPSGSKNRNAAPFMDAFAFIDKLLCYPYVVNMEQTIELN